MTALAIRLALAGGRSALVGLALTVVAVAGGTAVLLFALSAMPAFEERAARVAWRAYGPDTIYSDTGDGLLMFPVQDRFRDRQLVAVLVAPVGATAPVPPGIPRHPGDGEAFVSPALAELLATTPADELGNRIGRVVGTIDAASIGSPDELTAVIGVPHSTLEAIGVPTIAAFPREPPGLDVPLVGRVIILVAVVGAITPVAVFVATATRLTAARREQRLAALRLVGATPRQVSVMAAIEALLATIPGAALGVGLFLAARPLVARIELDGHGWYPETIAPPLLPAIALLALVPVVGAAAAQIALRRVVVSPLGVHRRAAPRAPSRLGLLVLGGSIALLLASLALFEGFTGDERIILPAAAFGGILVGIVQSGPWFTALLGRALCRAPGATLLLTGRRLSDDPRGSFGAIAGVIMAVYVASAFFGIVGYAQGVSSAEGNVMRPGQLAIDLAAPAGAPPDLVARVAAAPGVVAVQGVRGVEVHAPDGNTHLAWVARCSDVLGTLDIAGATCSAAPVHATRPPADIATGTYLVRPDRSPPGRFVPASAQIRVGASTIGRLNVSDSAALAGLPELIVDPSLLPERGERFPVTRVFVTTDGTAAAVERARTIAATLAPGSEARTTEERAIDSNLFAELARIVAIGTVGSLVLAGCSLAVATTTALLERRRQFALLRSAGMPVGAVRSLVLVQAAAPLVSVAVLSAVLGIVTAQLILRVAVGESEVPLPDGGLYLTLGASLFAAMLVVVLTLPPLERLTRPGTVRLE